MTPAGHNYVLTEHGRRNCTSFLRDPFLEKEKRVEENLQKMKLLPIFLGSSGIFAQNGTTEAPINNVVVDKPCDSEAVGAAVEIELANETEVEQIQLELKDFTLKAAKERETKL